jgi:hypothetical protein
MLPYKVGRAACSGGWGMAWSLKAVLQIRNKSFGSRFGSGSGQTLVSNLDPGLQHCLKGLSHQIDQKKF